MDIQAIAFDLDGTLYPNHKMYMSSMLFSFGRFRLLYHFGRVRKTIRKIRPIKDFRATQAQLLANSMKIAVELAEKRIERTINGSWERYLRNIKPYRYVPTFIEKLKKAGLKLGVLSDFPIGNKLEFLALSENWDCVISAEDTGYLKPNPEPFMQISECLKTPAANILFVGNNYEYDIIGASNVGMKTAHLSREVIEGTVADLTFSDYVNLDKELFRAITS